MARIRTKELKYITNNKKRAVWLRAFHIWQHKPHEVAPLTDTPRRCSSCGTEFQGNYCPRCGQAAAIGRFSFKKALLLFLDVWGVGNRGMFRSIRDLMLRPGYMIRDYLSGMQSAYFPPFKMFFLLTALSLLVKHGFTFLDNNTEYTPQNNTEVRPWHEAPQDSTDLTTNYGESESPLLDLAWSFAKQMDHLRESNPAIFALLSLLMFSMPLYLFLRKSPTIPDLRYSEFVVALVYTANAYTIYTILGNVLNFVILHFLAVLIVFVALKQFSGFSKSRLLGYIILTAIISFIILVVLAAVGIYIAYLYYGSPEQLV